MQNAQRKIDLPSGDNATASVTPPHLIDATSRDDIDAIYSPARALQAKLEAKIEAGESAWDTEEKYPGYARLFGPVVICGLVWAFILFLGFA